MTTNADDSHPTLVITTFLPEVKARLQALDGAGTWTEVTPERTSLWNAPYGPVEDWNLDVADLQVDGPHGPIPIRVYRPVGGNSRRPCLIWCHGGGFVGGDLDMPEAHEVSRGLAGRAGAVVVSVAYHLCPRPEGMPGIRERPSGNHPVVRFPIPHDDVMTIYRWTREMADELGIDRSRIAVGGASAGANLAAGVALHLRDRRETPWQVFLAYPVLHPVSPRASPELEAALLLVPSVLRITRQTYSRISENYLGGSDGTASPYAFAGLSDDLAGYPPTLVDNAEFDDLRASGERFASQLRNAGVHVEQITTPGVPHGFLNCVGLGATKTSIERIADRLMPGWAPSHGAPRSRRLQ